MLLNGIETVALVIRLKTITEIIWHLQEVTRYPLLET